MADGVFNMEVDEMSLYDNFLNGTNSSSATTITGNGNPNATGGVEDYTPYFLRPETYIVPVVFAIIFVVGVVGNGTLVIVFMRHRAMRNVPNTYILSLALADLLVILTSVPFTSTLYTVESWPFGLPVCIVSETAKDISIGVSVFTLTALSADRFFAIVDPFRMLHTSGGSRRATRLTIFMASMIWLLAIICALPAATGTYLRSFRVNAETVIYVCYPYPEEYGEGYPKLLVLLKFLIFYAIPLTIIAIFYALMARHLILSAKNVPGELRGAQRQVRARRKVAVTVLAFALIFALCFLPYHASMMWFYYSPTAQSDYNVFWHILRIAGFCLTFVNSCVNPVALYCISGTFRKHFNRYLLCRKSQSRDHTGRRATSMSLTTSRNRTFSRASGRRYPNNSIRRCGPETSVTMLGNGNNPVIFNEIVCSKM